MFFWREKLCGGKCLVLFFVNVLYKMFSLTFLEHQPFDNFVIYFV
jgi:hypothetical protein